MKRPGQRIHGFTIVELLIVIIVIAILATVTMATYSGAQQKSRDAETASQVKQYVEALNLYRAYNGKYPGSTTDSTCLGTGYPGGTCWLSNVNESSTFMTDLTKYKEGLTRLKQGAVLRGGIFSPAGRGNKVDGVNTNMIAYIVTKSGKCPYGPVLTYSSGQLFTSAEPASQQSTTPDAYGEVQCWISLDK